MAAEPGSPADWLRFARSDLAIAQRPPEGAVLLEALCFHAQQAVEKSLKAVLLAEGICFPRTHSTRILLNLLPTTLPSPGDLGALAALTDYAASSRYPGDYEPVTTKEYHEALGLAEAVVQWATSVLDKGNGRESTGP